MERRYCTNEEKHRIRKIRDLFRLDLIETLTEISRDLLHEEFLAPSIIDLSATACYRQKVQPSP